MGKLDSKRVSKRVMFNPNDQMFKPAAKRTPSQCSDSRIE